MAKQSQSGKSPDWLIIFLTKRSQFWLSYGQAPDSETKPIRGGPDWLVAFITKRSQFGLPDSLFQKFQISKSFCHHDDDRDAAGSCVDGAHVQSNSTSIMGSGEFG